MDRPNNNTYSGQNRASALRNSRSPPRNDYSGGGAAGARQRSRGYEAPSGSGSVITSNGKALSPLRSRVAQQSQSSNTGTGAAITSMRRHMNGVAEENTEDMLYERSRQTDLRRQIEEKEKELETVSSKHRDRQNRHAGVDQFATEQYRSGSASGAGGFQNSYAAPQQQTSSFKRGSNSPLRQRDDSQGLSGYQGGSYARSSMSNGLANPETVHHRPAARLMPVGQRPPIPQMDNYVASRQKSPNSPGNLRRKAGGSRSPTRDIDMRDAASGLVTGNSARATISPVRSNEYLTQLQQDNMSLQKRLNLVLQELDRVNRDRSKMVNNMAIVEKEVNHMQNKLADHDDADRQNNGIQLDVNGQRDNNVNLKGSITDVDMSRADCVSKLRSVQSDVERRNNMGNELKDDLQKKMDLCKQLEGEQYHAHEKINDLERQISALGHTGHEDDTQIDSVKRIIDKLADERDDLHNKLEQLNHAYENCVSEISRERAQMQGHNRHHNKLLVAKVTFSLLEHMFQKRKQEAMNEFFQYCKFDSKCHNTLKQFVKTVERLGQFRQRIAIKQWHQRTFKPMEMKVQQDQLCDNFMRKHLLSKMFNHWRSRQLNSENLYGAKNKALQAIWNSKAKDCAKDVQRAFQMWKDNIAYQRFRRQRCKKLVWKSYSNKLARAFQTWQNYSMTLTAQCRYHILAKTQAEQQLLRITFCTLRFNLREMRRKRHNRLRMYLKAWKESRQYDKFIMHAQMTVLGFKKDCNKSMLKMCFDAMRINKEEEKFMMMTEALEQDCNPAIESLNKNIEQVTQVAVRSGRKKGLDAIKGMIYRQVAEYFNKWKGVQQRNGVMLNQNLKGMIIKRWQQIQREAFDLWKKGKAHQEITMQGGMIMEMQEEGSNLAAEVEEMGKKIEIKKKQVDRSGRSALNRGTNIMKKRYLKQCFERWAETNKVVNNQSDGADVLRTKMRNRFLRQGFDLFVAGLARVQLTERNEGSCEHIRKTLEHRTMRKCFNGIKLFNERQNTAQRYWKILLGKMDHWMKKRAFGIWMDGGNQMKMEMHMETQNCLTEEMTVKNNELGGVTKKLADKSARNAVMQGNLEKMGQRNMANHFVRAYNKRTCRALENWKEWHRASKHREAIMKRTIDHWLKKTGKQLLAIMLNWKAQSKISDVKKAIFAINDQSTDIGLVQAGDSGTFEESKAALILANETMNTEVDQTCTKRAKVMALMCDNTNNNHYQGKLRAIFLAWAAHTKRMTWFTKVMTNTISKSSWQRGFQNIREFARDKQLTRDQNKGCNFIRKLYWRRNCGQAFNKWRQTEYEQTWDMIHMTEENTAQMQVDHVQRKRVIQKQNMVRSTRIVHKSNKHGVFQAWKNITRMLKHRRVSTENLLQMQSSYAIMRCIKKWRGRAEMTGFARGRIIQFAERKAKIYKRSCFRQLMLKHQRDKALVLKLANLTAKFNNTGYQSAFQMIKNFSTGKQNVHDSSKSIATRNLHEVLNQIYLRKLDQNYTHFRRQVHCDRNTDKKKKTMFGHVITRRTRDAFNKWKQQACLAQTVIEVNEIGPIAEQVLDAQLDVHNLRKLMDSEGFTEHQKEDITHNANIQANELLAKSIGRWKQWNGTDDYLKPKMFDRWRRFVKFRKIVKHWLDFMTNRQEHEKADMSHMFNKWKFHFSDKQDAMQKKTRAELMTRAVFAAKRLEVLADSTQQDEEMINHISDQNEELFNNYRKSQRLALALGRDNHRFGMMKAFTAMMVNSSAAKGKALGDILGKNVGLIGGTKDKMTELERDNEALANENEELRQFSLDGYQLGKNVSTLTTERQKLSVDLADKAETIKRLLDENANLSDKLKQTQSNVLMASRA